jgi:hypothetical protein
MCEILLCVKDRGTTGKLAIDSKAPKQGDVIAVHPDGWGWGACELGVVVPGNPNGNHNFFRVIKLPNVTVNQASSMLAPEADLDPQHPSPYLQYRAFFLDKSKIPSATMQALLDNWNDDGRTNGFISLNYTAAQIASIKTARTAIPFP